MGLQIIRRGTTAKAKTATLDFFHSNPCAVEDKSSPAEETVYIANFNYLPFIRMVYINFSNLQIKPVHEYCNTDILSGKL